MYLLKNTVNTCGQSFILFYFVKDNGRASGKLLQQVAVAPAAGAFSVLLDPWLRDSSAQFFAFASANASRPSGSRDERCEPPPLSATLSCFDFDA